MMKNEKKKRVSPLEALKLEGYQLPEVMVETPKKKQVIAWEKWKCPFGTDMKDHEWPGAMTLPHDEDEFPQYYDDKDSEDDDDGFPYLGRPTQLIPTSMGVIPMTEYTNPGKIFNFWTGHTNFTITPQIKRMIGKTEGVETLTIFTRYRLRVGIGKLFDSKKVKGAISAKIAAHLNKGNGLCPAQLEEQSHKKAN